MVVVVVVLIVFVVVPRVSFLNLSIQLRPFDVTIEQAFHFIRLVSPLFFTLPTCVFFDPIGIPFPPLWFIFTPIVVSRLLWNLVCPICNFVVHWLLRRVQIPRLFWWRVIVHHIVLMSSCVGISPST